MFLSVEISSYNRWSTLGLVLERLSQQTYPMDRFEVVVADDSSNDGTFESIQEFASQAPFSLRVVKNDHGGAAATHNNGIRHAVGDIVLMIADDVIPTERLLEHHARLHETYPDPAVGVVGRLEQSATMPQTVFQQAWDRHLNARFPRNRIEVDYTDFWVNNVSFKRSFMLQHGMFPVWPPASHEDVELGYRLQKSGMRLLFCDEALAFHHHPETVDSVIRRSYAQGYHWALFEAHVPELWVRARTGHFASGDGFGVRLAFFARLAARTALFNSFTVPHLAVPLIKQSERSSWLKPFVPQSVGKVASYYFRKGVVDRERGLPYRPPHPGDRE